MPYILPVLAVLLREIVPDQPCTGAGNHARPPGALALSRCTSSRQGKPCPLPPAWHPMIPALAVLDSKERARLTLGVSRCTSSRSGTAPASRWCSLCQPAPSRSSPSAWRAPSLSEPRPCGGALKTLKTLKTLKPVFMGALWFLGF